MEFYETGDRNTMSTMNDVNSFNNMGYLLKPSLISCNDCSDMVSYLDTKQATVQIPFSTIPWGYGNLIGNEQFSCVYENSHILEMCHNLLGDDFVFNHLMVNNKAAWIGPGVEWHQETFNIDTYAPGAVVDDNSWTNFLQIYIALHPHNLENGCLKIIPCSHALGILPHEDIVNENFGHKRRVPSNTMDTIYATCGIKNVLMESGDVLFFNHRLVHGSASNVSPLPRKAIVLQARLPFEKNHDLFTNETKYRTNFVLQALEDKIDKIKSSNVYGDFEKKH